LEEAVIHKRQNFQKKKKEKKKQKKKKILVTPLRGTNCESDKIIHIDNKYEVKNVN
jgi:hypothetical protein